MVQSYTGCSSGQLFIIYSGACSDLSLKKYSISKGAKSFTDEP